MADHKTVVRRMFDEVINKGQLDLIDDLFDPDFQTTTPMGVMDLDGFRQFVMGWRAGFSDLRCEVDDLIAEDDTTAWAVRATGTHDGEFMGIVATGRAVDFNSLNTAHFRDGKCHRHTVLMDMQTTLQQLGVAQQSPAPA